MKISTHEVEQIRRVGSTEPADDDAPRGSMTHIMESSTAPDVIHEIASIVGATPDVREEVIEAIKARTSSGTYQVSSEDIADLILRRALADKVR